MTERKTAMRRLPVATVPVATVPVATVLGVLVLAGCAGSHVGDDWQCPIAQGSVCSSVAAADPAVPETVAPGALAVRAVRAPLYRSRGDGAADEFETVAESRCAAECGPLAWLARLFSGDGAAAHSPDSARAGLASSRPGVASADPAPAALPGAPDEQAPRDPADESLRTPETVGRVWIGPFVDAAGVYREAAYVRLVIEPAGWRLP